jgi:hypothetical protein
MQLEVAIRHWTFFSLLLFFSFFFFFFGWEGGGSGLGPFHTACHSSNKPPFLVYLLTLHPTLRKLLEQAGITRLHYENDFSIGHPGLNGPSSLSNSC